MRRTVVLSSLLMLAGLMLIACGTTADALRPTFEPTSTFDFRARLNAQETRTAEELANRPVDEDAVAVADDAAAEAATEAVVPSTVTPLPPTPTLVSPTAPPATATPEPTEVAAELTLQDLHPDLPESADPVIGEIWFNNTQNDIGQYCAQCHNPDEPIPGQGPYVYGIANVAGDRVEGVSAVEYLYTSITNPNDYILEQQGDMVYASGVMPQNWTDFLSETEIYDIVAYLLTLDQE